MRRKLCILFTWPLLVSLTFAATPAEYYVDPGGGNDTTGDGTIGTPWATVQHALDTISQGADGDRINIKAGTDDTLASTLSLATFGSPTVAQPLILEGYTTTAGDGGEGGLNGNGAAVLNETANDYFVLRHLHVHNSGTQVLLRVDAYSIIEDCRFDNSTHAYPVWVASGSKICRSQFSNFSGNAVYLSGTGGEASYNYFKNDATRKFASAIFANGLGSNVYGNIVSIDSASNGIVVSLNSINIEHNTIYGGQSGTGAGIVFDAVNHYGVSILNNIISDFIGAGGDGIDFASTTAPLYHYASNVFYNNTANETSPGVSQNVSDVGNATVDIRPVALSGSDTFATRFTYFAPVDTGAVINGAYPSGGNVDIGAVQHADPAASGGETSHVWVR